MEIRLNVFSVLVVEAAATTMATTTTTVVMFKCVFANTRGVRCVCMCGTVSRIYTPGKCPIYGVFLRLAGM